MKTYGELLRLITQRGVHPVFGGAGEFDWYIEQNAEELAHFLVHMQELGVSSILEIGTGWRAGLARFLADDMGWEVVSIDIHDYGHQFSGIRFLQLADVPDDLPTFDLVLIDGDHAYEAVKADHERWGKLATKVIAFHDIAGLRDCEDVARYWSGLAWTRGEKPSDAALKSGYHEIIAEGNTRGGIGYIVLAEVSAVKAEGNKPAVTAPAKTSSATPRKPTAKKPTPAKKPAAKAAAKK